MTDMDEWQWARDWLSDDRLAPYLAKAHGDMARALDLYEYNSRISAAIKADLDHVEVAVRNAYDKAMAAYPGTEHWVFNGGALFPMIANRGDAGARDQLERAIRDAGGPSAPPGKVIAELTMGFWKRFSDHRRESPLWAPYANKAFSNGTPRHLVHEHMTHLVAVRNRVAHAERIVHLPLVTYRARIDDLARRVNPQIAEWIRDTSTVARVQQGWVRYQQQRVLRPQLLQQQKSQATLLEPGETAQRSADQKEEIDRLRKRAQLPGNDAYRARKSSRIRPIDSKNKPEPGHRIDLDEGMTR